jgi:hypothetical protein
MLCRQSGAGHMLRRVENVSITHKPGFFTKKGPVRLWVGSRVFANRWHGDNEGLNQHQVYALLVTREQRNQARINRAQTMVAMQQE